MPCLAFITFTTVSMVGQHADGTVTMLSDVSQKELLALLHYALLAHCKRRSALFPDRTLV